MFIFKIFTIFGFMTGPLIAALIGGIGIIKLYDVFKGLLFGGFSGTTADATRAGGFVSTVAAVTAVTGMNKVSSKLRTLQRHIVVVEDKVNSTKHEQEK